MTMKYHGVWVRAIVLFFAIGANLFQMAKNKSHVFAKLAKEFGGKIHRTNIRHVSCAKGNDRKMLM